LWRGFKPEFAGGEAYAENRLVAVTITTTGHRSEFGYDGMGRRVQIRELDSDSSKNLQIASDKKYLWDGLLIADERDATGGIVQKRFYTQGFVDTDGTVLFYTRDHLGSIRELTDNSQTIRARYDYAPYGQMTKVNGDRDSSFAFAGMQWHGPSGLSRDPIGESGGINLYVYVDNAPLNAIDMLGLCSSSAEEKNICLQLAMLTYEHTLEEINDEINEALPFFASIFANNKTLFYPGPGGPPRSRVTWGSLVAPSANAAAHVIGGGFNSQFWQDQYNQFVNDIKSQIESAEKSYEAAKIDCELCEPKYCPLVVWR
jgi:YD repeat-containing protein